MKKANDEEKEFFSNFQKEEIHTINLQLFDQIKNLQTILTRLEEENVKIRRELKLLKTRTIKIEIPKHSKNVIVDTNFFKIIHDMKKKEYIVFEGLNIKDKNILLPAKVRIEATSSNNKYNYPLVGGKMVDDISASLNTQLVNWSFNLDISTKIKLENALKITGKNIKEKWFFQSADARILVHIWNNPGTDFTIITADGDFKKWKNQQKGNPPLLSGKITLVDPKEILERA